MLRHMQAAAEREHPAGHPVCRAASVRAFLQRQSSVRARLLCGAAPSERSVAKGVVSLDSTLYALLPPVECEDPFYFCAEDNEAWIDIHDVAGRQLVHSWDLPLVASYPFIAPDWLSGPSGDHLLLAYGGAWQDPFKGCTDQHNMEDAGLLFLDAQTGEHHIVELPAQTADWDECSRRTLACPGQGLVLAVHSRDEDFVLSVYDCQGTLVHSISNPEEEISHFTSFLWSSDAQAVAMFGHWGPGCVWVLASNTCIALDVCSSWAAWATPGSGSLLIGECPCKRVVRYTSESQPAVSVMDQQQLSGFPEHVRDVAWGSRLAVLVCTSSDPKGSVCSELQIWTVSTGRFTLEHIVSTAPRLFDTRWTDLSGDGQLWAGLTGVGDNGTWRERCLAVVHLNSGVLQEFSLPDDGSAGVSFSLDCSAVLVGGPEGRSHLFSLSGDAW